MPIQFLIQIDDAGRCNVNGPIENKILCYGILDVAKEAVAEYHRKKAENLIQPASLIVPENFNPHGSN